MCRNSRGLVPLFLDPILYEDVNIKGTMNLLEMCKKYNVKKFIQASSSSVYGEYRKSTFQRRG